MSEAAIGIIGGSGLYEIDGLERIVEKTVETPFGDPSDALVGGVIEGREVCPTKSTTGPTSGPCAAWACAGWCA